MIPHRSRRLRRSVPSLLLGIGSAFASVAHASSPTEGFEMALSRWDLEDAERWAERSSSPSVEAMQLGIVAVYEGDYATAEAILITVLAGDRLSKEQRGEAEHYLSLARGAQRALGPAIVIRSDDDRFEAVFADAKDALLAPYLFEAMARAREELGRTLGVAPTHRVRFEFLDNPAKLAMVTPLTVENIRTTGTVGVTKYRRIMMITPRVMLRGYGWIDTAVHEYVHYLLTLRTNNLAPVWMQEGFAKLLETRWRSIHPPPLDAAIAYRLHHAIARDELVTLDQMYPSVAMLPSAELAALAYAEVESMLGLLQERKGDAGLAVLLDAVAGGEDPEQALALAWGSTFDDFMDNWKRVTKQRTADAEKTEFQGLTFADDAAPTQPPLEDVFSQLAGGRARQHARLGALLQARDHREAAAVEYEKARSADPRARRDPTLARRLGRLYVELEQFEDAVPPLKIAADADPHDANLAAAQGRALLRTRQPEDAHAALMRAIRVNPFIPELHCDLAELAQDVATIAREEALCVRP